MAKRLMKCPECGSEDVVKDAWASWDVDAQDWVLQTIFDQEYCTDCENNITIVEEDADE